MHTTDSQNDGNPIVNNTHLAEYYADRASEYDAIYSKPERQSDIELLANFFSEFLKNKNVLEVACGTGYWTRYYGPKTLLTTAIDCNNKVLSIARNRLDAYHNIRIVNADAFSLHNIFGNFNSGIAAFWWSHIEKTKIGGFLETFHAKLAPGSLIVMADNNYVEGSNTHISRTDSNGNSYQLRRLKNGRIYEILKNFPSEAEFMSTVEAYGKNIQFKKLTYFWYGVYEIA